MTIVVIALIEDSQPCVCCQRKLPLVNQGLCRGCAVALHYYVRPVIVDGEHKIGQCLSCQRWEDLFYSIYLHSRDYYCQRDATIGSLPFVE